MELLFHLQNTRQKFESIRLVPEKSAAQEVVQYETENGFPRCRPRAACGDSNVRPFVRQQYAYRGKQSCFVGCIAQGRWGVSDSSAAAVRAAFSLVSSRGRRWISASSATTSRTAFSLADTRGRRWISNSSASPHEPAIRAAKGREYIGFLKKRSLQRLRSHGAFPWGYDSLT